MTFTEHFNKNPESKPYVDRLVREWEQHGKIIIAVGFDDTISPWKLEGFDPTLTLEVLKLANRVGAYIVIFTACNPDRYGEIHQYCHNVGLHIDAINETPIELPYGKNGKIYANIFIDDRAGINEALKILEFSAYQIQGSKNRVGDFDF